MFDEKKKNRKMTENQYLDWHDRFSEAFKIKF